MRKRLFLGGVALLLGAIVAGWIVSGRDASPPLSAHALPATPWSAALDQQTGRLFIANRSFGAASTAYAFASASSYSFAVNGNIGSLYNSHQIQGADTLSVLGADGAALLRTVPVGGDPGTVAVDPRRGLVYLASEDDDTVSVFDARTAALLRTIRVGTRPNALALSGPTGRLFVVNAGDGTVGVIDTGSGRVLRTVAVPTASDAASMAVDTGTGRVYVAAAGALSTLDARSGVLLGTIALAPPGATSGSSPSQTRPANLPLMTSMAVDERASRIYILDAGALTIVGAGDLRVLRRLRVGADATALALDGRDGYLVLTRMGKIGSAGAIAGTGSLEVRNARTGALLRTVSLGMAPIAVAVDARTGRAIVVDAGGERRRSDPWGWLPNGIRRRLPPAPGTGTTVRFERGAVLALNLAELVARRQK